MTTRTFNGNGKTLEERIFPRLTFDAATGCWNFPPHRGALGYGTINAWGRMQKVHRVVYHLLRSPLARTTHLHHKCGNPACCNPNHLQPTDQREHNSELSPKNFAYKHRTKTHCKHGHPLGGDNVRVHLHHGRRLWTRECVTCTRQRNKEFFERNREKKLAENREWYHTHGKALRQARKANTA